MTIKQRLRASCALACLSAMTFAQGAAAADVIELGKPSSAAVAAQVAQIAGQPTLTHAAKVALLKQRVKYVFVLFQENRSFDMHFGTFPGVDGLYSPGSKAGVPQQLVDTSNNVTTISPFLIPQTVKDINNNTVSIYPADTQSVDHSHIGIVNDIDVTAGVAANDRYALNEEKLTTAGGQIVSRSTGAPLSTLPPPALATKQMGELVMGHLDCDTIPFLWQFADRFTLFDNFHMTITGPSTPNAIAMIAGQSGETQWALHPSQGSNNTGSPVIQASGGEPVVGDPGPFAGSNLDQSPVKPSYNPNDENPNTPALNQTYASLPLSFMGSQIENLIQFDQNPALDLLDVQHDIKAIAANNPPVPWAWYQEGYDHESTDGSGPATHATYIVHHEGPQYFGYIGDNTAEQSNLGGLGDFFRTIGSGNLPTKGGVFYVRGGYGNLDGLVPQDPGAAVQAAFLGNDDHPGYSDAQISEALLADEVNAIAASPYWRDSAIIITYDETDGMFDHGLPQIRSYDPEGAPLSGGPRIPAIVISPYAVAHGISHQYSEHSSVIKFIEELFSLKPLGNLPDEVQGRKLGQSEFNQSELGPADTLKGMGDLTEAFDNNRLMGNTRPLPSSYAAIPAADVTSLPHYGGKGCYTLNIVPTDYQNGTLIDPPPSDFNPRPFTSPGIPTSGTWTP